MGPAILSLIMGCLHKEEGKKLWKITDFKWEILFLEIPTIFESSQTEVLGCSLVILSKMAILSFRDEALRDIVKYSETSV